MQKCVFSLSFTHLHTTIQLVDERCPRRFVEASNCIWIWVFSKTQRISRPVLQVTTLFRWSSDPEPAQIRTVSKQVPHLRFPGQTLNKMRRQAKVATGIRDIQMVYGGVFLIR